MNLPDFSDFVASVDVEAFKAEFARTTPHHIIQFDLNDTGATEKAIELLMQDAASTAAKISFTYLRAYHEWLQAQLQQ